MTSEGEVQKTSEFLRRRKLRIQQVREQSKDIARIIRQRAKVEKLRQVVELDAKKEKDYLQRQDKVVKKLEELYSKGLENVGTSHRDAGELTQPGELFEHIDLSRLRGKEAAAELKRQKQQKLDEQKKSLDRKVQARKAANVLSREKSTTTASKLSVKSSNTKISDKTSSDNKITTVASSDSKTVSADGDHHGDKDVTKNDMASQWDAELLPNEWEPQIPALAIPKEDSVKEFHCNDVENNTEKQKRPNLFALSDEMPSSLRGNRNNSDDVPTKPSLTLVSEYIQNRALRLREPEPSKSGKKKSEDLATLKQTILRTRTSKTEGNPCNDERLFRDNDFDNGFTKKKSVTMYNHSTRDSRDVPFGDDHIVIRDIHSDKNAYSEALSETVCSNNQEEKNKKMHDMTNKIAMTRQNVEKEYKDTMAFLQSLPKNKGTKPLNICHKDDQRLQMQKESRQKMLQQEFKNIERASRLNGSVASQSTKPSLSGKKERRNSNSPSEATNANFIERDFQYSWMPVPDSDCNLAVHTIPTAIKEGKAGNSVKFSKVDSYHEYRSRHKHTPPTKDTNNHDKKTGKRFVEAVIIQQKNDNSSSSLSIASNNSSTGDQSLGSKEKNRNDCGSSKELTDAERIIIYKILDYKNKRKDKTSKKHKVDEGILNWSKIENPKKTNLFEGDIRKKDKDRNKETATASGDHEIESSVNGLDEGIYKVDSEKGDNIVSMCFSGSPRKPETEAKEHVTRTCLCNAKSNNANETQNKEGTCRNSRRCDGLQRSSKCKCVNKSRSKSHSPIIHPSENVSATSFKTASNINTHSTSEEDGYIKLTDKVGQEKGNFYIGATGFLKDDAYEVIIQLRKKGILEEQEKKQEKEESVIEENLLFNKETIITENKSTLESGDSIKEKATNNGEKQLKDSKINHSPILTNMNIVKLSQNMQSNNRESELSNTNHTPTKTKHSFPKHDMSVATPVKDSYPIPSHIPKTEPIPRPATSSYTQTSLNSPNPRPPFLHTSSSTSTAYMSPPEVVLPNFFRRGYESCDESCQNDDLQYKRRKIPKHKPYSEEYSKCRCRRCLRTIEAYLRHTPIEQHINRLTTPPNTARSFKSDVGHDSYAIQNNKKVSTHSSPVTSGQNKMCRKLKTKSNSKMCCKHHSYKSKYDYKTNKQLSMKNTRVAAFNNKKSKVITNMSKNTSKSVLNPAIRTYINKLLALNRENIKAIQIINQECSTINTPASSIINIPSNFHVNKADIGIDNQISLQQIKNILRRQILNDNAKHGNSQRDLKLQSVKNIQIQRRKLRKKSFHKVKSLNISKKILVNTCISNSDKSVNKPFSEILVKSVTKPLPVYMKSHGHSSVSSEHNQSNCELTQNKMFGKVSKTELVSAHDRHPPTKVLYEKRAKRQYLSEETSSELPRTIISSRSTSTDSPVVSTLIEDHIRQPNDISTQTSRTHDREMNFMKLAEDKLQNMEKIADLTEKCTKRLSNLAKVLEEVRKNKSHAYSQISTTDSTDSDQKSDKVVTDGRIEDEFSKLSLAVEDDKIVEASPPMEIKVNKDFDSTDYESLLVGIPKPRDVKSPPGLTDSENSLSINSLNKGSKLTPPSIATNVEHRSNTKYRSKPPPALLRIHLKRPQENVVPHELSTVIEVDSPMSVKLKNQSSNTDAANQSNKNVIETRKQKSYDDDYSDEENDADAKESNVDVLTNSKMKITSTDSSGDSKLQMMDLNQFNEIMLRPFISIQEYAQDYYREDAFSKFESVNKNIGVVDDISSFNSDGSLPDVVAELLKRKLIKEPFKFDTASNLNSTTVSSESTLSVLALSRVRKDKTKYKVVENKENIAETSDTLSISSNPDLENAFKKLGMGWASSTLKKTKERLALSSSSNTSSSSLSQFKFKNSMKQDMPTIVTDSVSSVPNLSKRSLPERHVDANNVEQQTSLSNSMTVKEFLTNELAKKITFTSKNSRNDEEFVSLVETKMPEEFKNSSQTVIEQHSGDSVPSGNNRARTSTPVQIFKSVTYHSSSSSNMSNGLFSNADDLSSVKLTSTSMRYHSTSEKDELTVPNYSLKMRKGLSDGSKTDSC